MKKLLALSSIAFVAQFANAEVLNFDDVSTSVTQNLAGPYHGFTIDANTGAINGAHYSSAYNNTVTFPSSPNAIFNWGGVLSTTWNRGSLFTFDGMMVATFAEEDDYASFSSTRITVEGYLAGNLVGSSSMDLDVPFAHLGGISGNLDELRILNDGTSGHWWLADNMEINSVPEPVSMVVLGAGALALARKRRAR